MYLLRTLGALSLERDGLPVETLAAHRNALAVLAILAADGTASRDRLMALLWPESDTERARGSLKQVLHLLRHRLGTPQVVVGRPQLALDSTAITSDLEQFRRELAGGDPARAAALYRGAFLEGAHFNGSAELEEWIVRTRAELAREHAAALERLAREADARGAPDEAVRWWERRQQEDPLDARVAAELIRALAAAGRRHAAMEHAQRHAELLQTEAGLPPDPAVAALAEEVRRSLATASGSSPHAVAPVAGDPGDVDPAFRHPAASESAPPAFEPAPRRRWTRRAPLIAAAVLVAILVALATSAPDADTPAAALEPDLVALAPFQVSDPTLTMWREGLGDILARDLDGAGPLRTVSPSVALRRWEGRADRASAERLAARTGAAIVIYGDVVRRGPDSIGIRATVLDLAYGITQPDLEVFGSEERLGELADSLGVQILRALGQHRPIAATRHTSIGSRSLPALKAFLLAEQFYRRGEMDSALAHYDRAITLDTTFALALRRMNWVLGSGARTAWRYSRYPSYVQRAVVHNHGLGPRDSMLLLADSLANFPREAPTPDALLGGLLRARDLLEELARRYPDDPQIWYELGDRYAHARYPVARWYERSLAVFDRAIALDSGFAPAYMHAIGLAFQMGDEARARRVAEAYVSQGLGSFTPDIELAARLLDPGADAAAIRRLLAPAHLSTLDWTGGGHFGWRVDSNETAVLAFRSMLEGGHDDYGAGPLLTDTLMHRQLLAQALAFRGHLREAAAVGAASLADPQATPFSSVLDPFWDLIQFGALDPALVPRNIADAWELDWAELPGTLVLPRELHPLPWFAAQGDSAMIRRFGVRAALMERSGSEPVAKLRGRYAAGAAQAYLSLVRGDTAGAVRRLEAIPDSLCLVNYCYDEKFMLARLLMARGDDARAATVLDAWEKADRPRPIHVVAALERGRLAERLADTTTALQHYGFVTNAWLHADVELQRFVEEAREGIVRLRAAEVAVPSTPR